MKTLVFVYFAFATLILSSCGRSGGKEATVSGMNGCISDPASCNNSVYQQNQGGGYYPYGYNSNYGTNYNYSQYYNQPFSYYGNSAYLCNCPRGTLPTYNSYAGLGCVRTSATLPAGSAHRRHKHSQKAYSYFYYLSWNNSQWYNTPYLSTYYYNQSSCYNGAVQSCLLGTASSMCPAGYLCRATGSSTTLGLCTASYR